MRRTAAALAAVFLISSTVVAREVSITILHTCDLHGQILPVKSHDALTDVGGLARCATRIREIRSQNPNVLLVDAGDTLQGSAISWLSGGRIMVRLLNALRYDAWVWGNHEFDWGLDALAGCAELAEMPVLNADISRRPGPSPGFPNRPETDAAGRILSRIQPYRIREIDGVKVGIIGLTNPGIPSWSRPRLIAGLQFADSADTLKQILPAVRKAGAQIVVLVCHQGYREWGDDSANRINALARNYPELDVIIGAHTHRNYPQCRWGDLLYCQADCLGIHLGRIDLVFDTDQGRLVRRHSETLLMGKEIPADSDLLRRIGPELERARQYLDTTIGEATGEFDAEGAPQRESAVHNLICEAIASALRDRGVAVRAVVHGILNERASIRRGVVTVGDVWRILPYENTIGVAQLTPAELREVLDENVAAYRSPSFRGIWGLRVVLDPDAGVGHRILALQGGSGSALDESERIPVAFNSYDLAGGGQRWKRLREIVDRPSARLVEYDVLSREALRDYIRRQGKISPSVGGWWTIRSKSTRVRGAAPGEAVPDRGLVPVRGLESGD